MKIYANKKNYRSLSLKKIKNENNLIYYQGQSGIIFSHRRKQNNIISFKKVKINLYVPLITRISCKCGCSGHISSK